MRRFWTFLLDARVLGVIGLVALACFLFLGAEVLKIGLVWAALLLLLALLVWGGVWLAGWWRARRAARALEQGIDAQGASAARKLPTAKRLELDELRTQLLAAVKTIRTSKIGQRTGAAALYELPWYMVIGSPAAGKSMAIVKSGLNFPFAGNMGSVVEGIGGTRHCDWFFTTEGILIDTAGRYAVHDEDRQEWLGFLALLKKHRPKAPINGIVIAASAAELAGGRPEQGIALANSLRQRVQELTEELEVFAPVYVVFTKADLIAGFAEFFDDVERDQRERVWGATLPYQQPDGEAAPAGAGAKPRGHLIQLFEQRFDELADGLKDLSVVRMGMQRGKAVAPGVLTFPLEFAALKPALSAFIATLFDNNVYQFQPVFRGFYFTSAVQQGASGSRATERVAQQFALQAPQGGAAAAPAPLDHSYFLKDLFSKIIFGDRDLVRQYNSKRKLRARALAFGVGVVLLALVLGGWAFSWLGNQQMLAKVRSELDAARRQQAQSSDIGSRLDALLVLQRRIEQFDAWRGNGQGGRPAGIGFGLYQGDEIDRRLREEYFAGVSLVMLQPVAQAIETYLAEANRDPSRLQPLLRAPDSGTARVDTAAPAADARGAASPFTAISPTDSAEVYNALKTYLMLAEPARRETAHLNDQIARIWRHWLDDNRGTLPRDEVMKRAGQLISFTTASIRDPAFPQLSNQPTLVASTRKNLLVVMSGMGAVERVYANIKARASSYGAITVAGLLTDNDRGVLAGSKTVPGPFTRQAWEGLINKAIQDAAKGQAQIGDWVLDTSEVRDLASEAKGLVDDQLRGLYHAEYADAWRKFIQGVSVADFNSLDDAAERIGRLADAQNSPVKRLVETVFNQTSWDNKTLANEQLASTRNSALAWFKQTILRQAPGRVEIDLKLDPGAAPQGRMGPIAREFAPLARIMVGRDGAPAPMADYLAALGKLRTRLYKIRDQGDPGAAARLMLAQTLEGSDASELNQVLRVVNERVLAQGLTPTAREALAPLFQRPLTQAAKALVPATETELNRQWAAQVHEPFTNTLARKYPFEGTRGEASWPEINKIFGPAGAIAKYGADLGPLVTNRGNGLEARSWGGEAGIRIRPELAASYPLWVSVTDPGGGGPPAPGGSPQAPAAQQAVFEVMPLPEVTLNEYTLVIDGQTLRYRNGNAQWVRMVWPNPSSERGVRLEGLTPDGQTITFLNEPGQFGLGRMVDRAKKEAREGQVTELRYQSGNWTVALQLRIISNPFDPSGAGVANGGGGGGAGAGAGAGIGGIAALRGLRLPAAVAGIAGADRPAAAPAAVATPAPAGAAR